MKTKLQILKESTVNIFILGFLLTVSYSIMNFLIVGESWIIIAVSGLVSFITSCIIMGYLFEKEKSLLFATLQYIVIGIFSTLLTILSVALGLPYILELLVNETSIYWKNNLKDSGISGLFLIFPIILLSLFFIIFGLFAYLLVAYFLGTWLFSFIVQLIYNYLNAKKRNITSDISVDITKSD